MKKMLKHLIVLALLVFSLTGCAALQSMISDFPTPEEAAPQISAVASMTDGLVQEPYNTGGSIALGYLICMLRKWYKKQKGSKG